MLSIIDANCTGKTKKLIEYVGENGGVIACKHPEGTKQKAIAYGYPLVSCVSYYDYMSEYRSSTDHIYIDDLDAFLKFLNCDGYTLTVD